MSQRFDHYNERLETGGGEPILRIEPMVPEVFDPDERAREKAASREADTRAIASGAKSAEQVRRENASFAFQNVRLRYPARER